MVDKKDTNYFEHKMDEIQGKSSAFFNIKKELKPVREALKIILIYLFIGVIWILISDRILNFVINDTDFLKQIQLYKGWFYVFATGGCFYLIIVKKMLLFKQATDRIYEGYEELSATHEELIAMEEELNEQYNELEKHRDALLMSDQRYKLVVEGSNDGIWDLDLERGTYFFSIKMKSFFGYDENELVNTVESLKELLHPEDSEKMIRTIKAYLASKEGIYESTYRLRSKNEGYRWILSRGKGVWDSNGEPIRMAGSHTDITEKMQVQESLRQKSELVESVFSDTTMIVIVSDINGNIEVFNPSAAALTGYTEEEMVGNNVIEVLTPELNKREMNTVFDKIITNEVLKDRETPVLCKDGRIEIVLWNNTLIYDQKGTATSIVSMGVNITEKRNMENSLHTLAYYDVLTKLPNRSMFEEELDRLIKEAEVQNTKMAVIYINIDNFKHINDTKGHFVGDRLLCYISNILTYHIKEPNVIARLNGDEFGVLLTSVEENGDLKRVIHTLLKFLRRPWVLEKQEFFVSVSIGVALYPEHGNVIVDLMQNADIAMFHVKENGKDGYCIYNRDMREKAWKNIKMNSSLMHAIKNSEFLLYYQPQIDLKTNKIIAVEALIRWLDAEKGFIPPMEFIPFAEESGHIHKISQWVLETACEQTNIWKEKNYSGIKIAVNLSGKLLSQKNLANDIQNTLQKYHVKASEIELEITETAIIVDLENSVEVLKKLKELGISISLDDFGTGYSSLTYLQKLPIDILKIDREFIKNIVNESEESFIFKTIVELAHNLGLKVVAEGVETKEQLEFLRKNGCDIGQGYYFSKPVPAAELEELLKSGIRNEF